MGKIKHIGIVGVTAEGAALCYKTIVSEGEKKLGLRVHPEITLHNAPYNSIYDAQVKEDWRTVASILGSSLKKLKAAGAQLAIIPANSVHFVFDEISSSSPIPVINIVKTAVEECSRKKFTRVGVLGIGITMSKDLFKKSLEESGISYAVPPKRDQGALNRIIFEEIVSGKVKPDTAARIISIIKGLKLQGCDGVILACTELPLVINRDNSPLPFIDTTRLLALKALEAACL